MLYMNEFDGIAPEAAEIFRRMKAAKMRQKDLANALGIEENKITKVKNGTRQFQASEILAAQAWISRVEGPRARNGFDNSEASDKSDYVDVSVLPTFAGMGGGGNGEGDRETALISSSLIHHELRGKPSDFLLINVRGDSMEPDFRHGDQLLIDTRDTSPAQPGPFALWDGEWGEYVVKNVERAEGGRVRMFSTNTKYAASEIDHEATRIIGRPVWFARRL